MFKSFINIDSNDSKLIKKNIDLVIKSYPIINPIKDEILIGKGNIRAPVSFPNTSISQIKFV